MSKNLNWYIIYFPIDHMYQEFIFFLKENTEKINNKNFCDIKYLSDLNYKDFCFIVDDFKVIIHPEMLNYGYIQSFKINDIYSFIHKYGGCYVEQDILEENIISIDYIVDYLNKIFTNIKNKPKPEFEIGSVVRITNKNLFDCRATVIAMQNKNYYFVNVITGFYSNKLLNIIRIHKRFLEYESDLNKDILELKMPRKKDTDKTLKIEESYLLD